MAGLEDKPLGYLLHRVATTLRAEVATTVLEPLALAFPEYLCLRMLAQSPGASNAQLARDLGVSPQAMNKVLRELQQRGLVTRPATVPSGRALPASLSRDGIAILERIDPRIVEAERRVLAKLSERDRREFRRLLAAVA
ncbi:MarR family winged helix-turn-helix transcriptional regulator [Nocardia blacklockiae]|uniref:MarR family winged helix-turn-helix transcriptional regulator n=1 Tax=Nocardia blacklockiae TaxID=480036 RepID=UPI001894DD24|nr:MarR family transcriptional regulator [Nocardia blacklockiae]MBF6173862.1 MarR family transcriptional regulator [Nocardia blacklockiae]